MSRGKRKPWQDTHIKRERGQFAAFPRACQQSANYVRLTPSAKVLLHELNGQYNGENNGDLCAAWGTVKDKGLGCRATVDRAKDELEITGWIVLTRQGGRNKPNLYALTFYDIDECKGKLDSGFSTGKRFSFWRIGENPKLSARLAKQCKAA